MANLTLDARNSLKDIGNKILNGAADLLSSSDFISRTIGMNNSYEDIMYIVQSLGRKPISLLGKDYLFIYDHVRRNYQQGTTVASMMYGGGNYWCPKFTFYKERPTIKFADVYNDPLNLLARWMPDVKFNITMFSTTERFYAESNDGEKNNKVINGVEGNPGTASAQIVESFQNLEGCDLLRKTNENFINGKFNTLVARFHTNTDESRRLDDPTQTAVTDRYGMSHGRNLLKVTPDSPNGYNNPYCRVWTYHHQYHTINDMIRPFAFDNTSSAEGLESSEFGSEYGNGGFRTIGSKEYDVLGGSARLDTHGVLNYRNGFVNIAPTAKLTDYFDRNIDDKNDKAVSIKKCMFSLENLAWRDDRARNDEYQPTGTSPEQRGPLGGRIMWFPPYDISFSETVAVKWNSNEFIGRGENIYTYTNTERRGNLSFTLLIDHPSILDYWTGHDAPRGSLKNGTTNLLKGNAGGVDEINNQEQTLLRFFAGCDVLTAQPQKYKKHNDSPKEEVEKEKPNPMNDTGKPEKNPGNTICCILYFPNNYSGVDDAPCGKDKQVNAVNYLMNGIGAQKYDNNGTLDDIPVSLNVRPSVNNTLYGGYEVRTAISVATSPIPESSASAEQSTYRTPKIETIQYITDPSGTNRYNAKYGDNGEEYTLAKIVWNEKLKSNPKKGYKTYTQAGSKYWHYMRWYYRVDNAYTDDRLKEAESYIDSSCYNLNGSGYEKVNTTKMAKKIIVPGNFHLISFTSLFKAVEGENKVIDGIECGVNENDVTLVQDILNGKNGYKIKSIKFRGHASTAGYDASNKTLSDNRRNTLMEWLKEKLPESEKSKVEPLSPITQDEKDNSNYGHANDIEQKIWRSASVMIEYEQEKNEEAISSQEILVNDTNYDTHTGDIGEDGIPVTQGDSKTSDEYNEFMYFINNQGKEWYMSKMLNGAVSDTAVYGMWVEEIYKKPQEEGKKPEDPQVEETGTVERYDNEGEFFKLLEKKDAFLHHLVTDKIKYFDPAYHAISPEGFNARLTFLHQCTRQGATIGVSDDTTLTAHNLAFGRPPICVLRLGDFYYTKIVINSLTINYEDVQWDLNPEGIGVMPMFAKVNIDFTFLGGSDLAGPIARLQNAVSFNYYANTSVYDDRAEVVEYDPKGSGKEIKYKPFTYMDGTKTIGNPGVVDDTSTIEDN